MFKDFIQLTLMGNSYRESLNVSVCIRTYFDNDDANRGAKKWKLNSFVFVCHNKTVWTRH